MRLAERQDLAIVGTLAVAMRYSATVDEALGCASQHLGSYNPAVGFSIGSGDQPGQVRLDFQVHGHPRGWAQTAEHGLGLGWRTVTMLSERRCRLRGVWFPHPAQGSAAGYRSRFDAARLAFDTSRAALAIDAARSGPADQRPEQRPIGLAPRG